MSIGAGFTDRVLTDDEIESIVSQSLATNQFADFGGKRVLVIIPDGTRTAPIPKMFRLIHRHLAGRVAALDFIVALGTHRPMSAEEINNLVGVAPEEWDSTFQGVHVFNHDWAKADTFINLGTIRADEVAAISNGMLCQDIPVRINRLVHDYDWLIICGPVFPHEVVGFSGGNKYLFPGISGPEVIDLSHWLGALITSYAIIGTPGITPVRALINRAAGMVKTPKLCMALVMAHGSTDLSGLYVDTPEIAWAKASRLSAQLHINYVERPYQRVLSIMPKMYDDIWTAAKGMYKMEPVISDGGEVVIYAPHITEFSYTHGKLLAQIGYHVRDYFLKQWDRFKDYPGGILAHSTHLRGIGTYDALTGEHPRIQVTLATGISRERCEAHNLGYLDPDSVNVAEWQGREAEGVLVVPKAGEILYRLATTL